MAADLQGTIMLLGDSLTQGGFESYGFATKLAYYYNRKLDVINRGMSGYNTDWIIPVLEQAFPTQHTQQHLPKVRILTIWLGANDAALFPTKQHVPLPKYSANLAQLVRMVRDPKSAWYSPDTRVVLITPPPVNTYQWQIRQQAKTPPKELDRDFAITRTYAAAARDVAVQEGVPVLDLWNLFWDACGHKEEDLRVYLSDGLHLNEQGYSYMFDGLIKVIKDNWPELHYDNLRFTYTPYDEIDPENPRATVIRRSALTSE